MALSIVVVSDGEWCSTPDVDNRTNGYVIPVLVAWSSVLIVVSALLAAVSLNQEAGKP